MMSVAQSAARAWPSDPSAASDIDPSTRFVARQPIFDRQQEVFGYELLFRSSWSNVYDHTDGDAASAQILNQTLNIHGLANLTGGGRAFINFTRSMMINVDYGMLPPESTVIELLEDVERDDGLVAACRKLKDAGYMLALDDVVYDARYDQLIDLADIVKIDFMQTTAAQRRDMIGQFKRLGVCLLAEKVETHEAFREATESGYAYVQGFFFAHPQIVSGRDVPVSDHNHLLFLSEISRPKLDFDRLERIVKQDVSLSTKLLRYLNSAALGVPNQITSIRQALALLGERPLRRWASLVLLSRLAKGKPSELIVATLIRARFCELISAHTGDGDGQFEAFLVGMLSTIDVMLGRPAEQLLEEMPIPDGVKSAHLDDQTHLGTILGLAIACERADTQRLTELWHALSLTESLVAEAHRAAIVWAQQVYRD